MSVASSIYKGSASFGKFAAKFWAVVITFICVIVFFRHPRAPTVGHKGAPGLFRRRFKWQVWTTPSGVNFSEN